MGNNETSRNIQKICIPKIRKLVSLNIMDCIIFINLSELTWPHFCLSKSERHGSFFEAKENRKLWG